MAPDQSPPDNSTFAGREQSFASCILSLPMDREASLSRRDTAGNFSNHNASAENQTSRPPGYWKKLKTAFSKSRRQAAPV